MTTINFDPPKYCDYYKHLLVEEIYYLKRPIDLHYGMCSIIGKIVYQNCRFELENVSLSCFDKSHKLSTGAITIPLKQTQLLDPPLPFDEYVEIFGETIFMRRQENGVSNTQDIFNEASPTPKYLLEKLFQIKVELEDESKAKSGTIDVDAINAELDMQLDVWNQTLEPAIQVDSFKTINDAETIILCNLQQRAILMNRQKKRKTNDGT